MFARRVGEFHFISYISCLCYACLRVPRTKSRQFQYGYVLLVVFLCCSVQSTQYLLLPLFQQTLNTVLGTHLAHADTFRFDLFSSHEVWGWWEVLSIELQTRYHFLLHDCIYFRRPFIVAAVCLCMRPYAPLYTRTDEVDGWCSSVIPFRHYASDALCIHFTHTHTDLRHSNLSTTADDSQHRKYDEGQPPIEIHSP